MSEELDQVLIATQIDGWVHNTTRKRSQLLLNATDPSRSARALAFTEMGELCGDLIEELRAISAQLREESQAARFKSQEIVAESARLLTQCTPLTESQLLQIFKGDQSSGEPRE